MSVNGFTTPPANFPQTPTRTARRRKTFTGASKAEVRNRVSENAWAGGQAVRFSIARTVEAYHSRPPCAVGTFCRLSASAICR